MTAAAEAVRKTILDPLKDEAVEVGLLDKFVKVQTAPSYLHRLYNKRRIISEEGRFRGVVGTWVRGEVQRAVAKQEQVGIARDINRANDLNDQLNSALGRLDSVTTRVAGRQEVRSRKLDLIRKAEGDRFDALSGRVPSYVIEAAKAAKDDDTMIRAVAEVSKATKTRKRPLLDLLRSRGGVRVGSPLDGELRAMGITPKTAPGLFRREEGLAAVENLPASEDLWLAQLPTDQNGYAEPDAILAALRDEAAGSPIRTPDELADETARDVLSQNVEEWLRGIGLREDASAKEVREYLSQAVANDGRLSALDQKIGRMNGELEEFDRLTDEVVNQKLIVEAEAGKYADELNKLEEKINAVRDLATNSPAVSLLVDYADTRKAYARARYDQARLGNRIEAIERVSSEGRATAELEDELRALRSDKNKADERVIKARQKSEKLKPMLPKDKGDELDFSDQADLEAYADTIVDGIFDNITGKTVEDTPEWMVPVTQGPLKGRTFNIPDEMIEDFLENDIELVTQQYVKKMSAEVELTRAFGRADMRDQIDGIKAEYRGLRAAAKTEKERIKLDASETRDITHLEAFRDILRGTYKTGSEGSGWSAMTRLALSWNFITALGGVTLSSLPDAFSVLTKSGLRSVVRDGLPALTSKTQAIRIAKRDAFESGAISSTALNSWLAELAELNDPYASGSQAERIMNNVTAAFSKATFLDHWNDLMKTIVAVQTQQKVSRLLLNSLEDIPVPSGLSGSGGKQAAFGKLSKYERGYLGKLGIDEVMGARIAAQVKSFGLQEDGIWGLNLSRWSDKSAARVMRGAINKEADGVVITPGIADKPLWARTNTGKLILQFRSFGLAAHQRLLLSRLQGNPKHLAEFALFGTLGGMMVSYLKLLERGDYEGAERLTENPGLWVSDGFDRTGIASVLMDVSNTAEKVGAPFGIRTAAQLAVGDQDLSANVSRFASRNAAGALLGPSIGRLQDMATIASQLSNGEVNGQGARAIVRNVPGATLPDARTFFETQVKPALVNAVD
ncbi:hypothetical protein [Roseibium polysiphoniae]|uniref:hypothetical protein n=1 Tax=Roseibium polysiphoniae TaxID=2571221 RepID=UPI0032969FCF